MRAACACIALLCAGCLSAEAKTPSLVPIVIAAVDVPAGSTVTFDELSQRSVDAAFVTTSIVKPDSASYIVNQRIQFPVLAGDPMLWSMFETTSSKAAVEACRKVMPSAAADAPGQVAQARALAVTR